MLNGAESFQREILDDALFYRKAFPKLVNDDIVMLEKAGHGLHFEQPVKVRKLIHSFLLSSESDAGSDAQSKRAASI